MHVDGSIGSMLQGVSQQKPAVRPEGKVTEQVNFISDVVKGLTSRPALRELNRVTLDDNLTGLGFTDIEFEDSRYYIWYSPTSLRMWDSHGVPQTVTIDTGADDYLGTAMRSYVFDGKIYLVNRDKVVEKSSEDGMSDVLTGVAYISVLGGIFSRNYSIRVRYTDDTEAVGEYLTPDGTNEGDADSTRATHIAEELLLSLVDHENYKSGTAVRSDGTLYLRHPLIASVRVSDDDAGLTIRGMASTVEKLEDVAKTAAHGSLVKVTGLDEGRQDDYFLRFNSAVTDVLGEGFGSEGVWEEWADPSEVISFDLSTMPHVLEKTGPSSFRLTQGDWLPRRVGDSESNPFPDIVGHPIRDIGGFQSRLVLVGGPWCVMSRTNKPTDFFKQTVLTEVDTDPISKSTTQAGTVSLDWIIPFDRDLVIMTDPGEGQFVISGSSTLTPNNASIVTTTAFEVRSGGARPVETGRTILFPFRSGKFSGIKEFFTNDEVATNGANTISETVPSYIEGNVRLMTCNTNFNFVVMGTDAGPNNTVVAYQYLWHNSEQIQSAWHKWQFPHRVRHVLWQGSELFVLTSHPSQEEGKVVFVFSSLDLDHPVVEDVGYHITLDYLRDHPVSEDLSVTTPYTSSRFVQGAGCAQPGSTVISVSKEPHPTLPDQFVHTFNQLEVPAGATIFSGLDVHRRVKPTMPLIKDDNGRVLSRQHLVAELFSIQYEDTGFIRASMDSRYRDKPYEIVLNWFPIDGDPNDPRTIGLRTGGVDVPWGERTDWSEMIISSEDARPTTIVDVEFSGQAFKGSRG